MTNTKAGIVINKMQFFYSPFDGEPEILGNSLKESIQEYLRKYQQVSEDSFAHFLYPGVLPDNVLRESRDFIYEIIVNSYDNIMTILCHKYYPGASLESWTDWPIIYTFTETFKVSSEYKSGYLEGQKHPTEEIIQKILQLSWEASEMGIHSREEQLKFIQNGL